MKTCSKCGVSKEETEFYVRGGKRQNACKECKCARQRSYHAENREELAAKRKKYEEENREEIASQQKKYREENREEIVAYRKVYQDKNRQEIKARKKVYRQEKRDEIALYQKQYREENREKEASQQRRYREENREEISARAKVSKYGVTPGDLKRIRAEQGGVCAICGGVGGKSGLNVDHDHESGVVRGLLCGSCNRALGMLKDSSAVVQQALNYPETSRKINLTATAPVVK